MVGDFIKYCFTLMRQNEYVAWTSKKYESTRPLCMISLHFSHEITRDSSCFAPSCAS